MAGRRGRGRGRGRGRAPTKEEVELMDEAMGHFVPMGYPVAVIRSTVEQLIEVYGEEGMEHLKKDDFSVVQDMLFEKQKQEEQPQLLLKQEKQPQLLLEQEDPNMQKESAMSVAPVESDMAIVEAHNEILAIEGADPVLMDCPAPEATLPRPAATGMSRARRPCYVFEVKD